MQGDTDFFAVYDQGFFKAHKLGEAGIAHRIGELVWQTWRPKKVLDVGCAVGLMLEGVLDAAGQGNVEVTGIEAPQLMTAITLAGPEISLDRYRWIDLRSLKELAEELSRTGPKAYDLCISTEVAEHLPPECAGVFVNFVTAQADRVLWSAAHVGQDGTQHINERPHEYWADLFSKQGFTLNREATDRFLTAIGDMSREPWFRCLMVYEAQP